VEGNIAGVKAARLAKKREKDQEAFEAKKQKMQDEAEKGAGSIDDKFKSVTLNAFGVSMCCTFGCPNTASLSISENDGWRFSVCSWTSWGLRQRRSTRF
jgi:hypothetical protein